MLFRSNPDQQEDNLSDENNEETLNNLTISSNNSLDKQKLGNFGGRMGPSTAYNPDCYSSTEYLEYCIRKGNGIGKYKANLNFLKKL